MKLIKYGPKGSEKTGVEIDGKRYDCSDIVEDYNEKFWEKGGVSWLEKVFDINSAMHIGQQERWAAPVGRPGKLICIGLNYSKHARESGMAVPTEPVVFFKATSAIIGPFDQVVIPKNSVKTDWEVELALVIGKKASYIEKEDAMDHVGGYLLHNDISEREFQLERGGQWVKGKSCDTFAPLGPYLIPARDVKDPHSLNLWLSLNGNKLQNGNTNDFIFDIPTVISYLSQFMTLEAGDVISTGTPEGVGLGLKPPVYLKPGDVMELGIDGLGIAKQEVIAWEK